MLAGILLQNLEKMGVKLIISSRSAMGCRFVFYPVGAN